MSTQTIDPQTVAKVAYLARLIQKPEEEVLEMFANQVGAVLEYANSLQEVDVTGIDALDGNRTITIQELREDEVDPHQEDYQRVRTNIIHNFPNSHNNLLVIPGIFEND